MSLEYVLLPLASAAFAALGDLWLRFGRVTPEEEGAHAILLRDLVKARQRFLSALAAALLGCALAFFTRLFHRSTLEYTLKLLFLFHWLVPIAWTDGKEHIIPNRLTLAGLGAFLLFFLGEWLLLRVSAGQLLLRSALGLLFGGGLFFLCMLLTRGGMGPGDVKLFAVLGLFLGWEALFPVVFVTVLGIAVVGSILILSKKRDKKAQLPAGPFVLFALAAAILLGI